MAGRRQVRRLALCRYRLDPSVVSAGVDAVAPLSRRYRTQGRRQRIAILSTSWQTVALMAPQDQDYRAFITQLHRTDEAGRQQSRADRRHQVRRSTPPAIVVLVLVAIAMTGLLARAIATGEYGGALFLVGFAALFGWQIGGFIQRNRPQSYTFDQLPKALLP